MRWRCSFTANINNFLEFNLHLEKEKSNALLETYSLFITTDCQDLTMPRGNGTDDVVYLNNGSIVRGQIIERVPGDFAKIRTVGGSVFVLDASEIVAIENVPTMPIAKKKNPVLAAAMSFLIPGLGQLYNGDEEKGIGYFAIFAAGPTETNITVPVSILVSIHPNGGMVVKFHAYRRPHGHNP